MLKRFFNKAKAKIKQFGDWFSKNYYSIVDAASIAFFAISVLYFLAGAVDKAALALVFVIFYRVELLSAKLKKRDVISS
jgi:hypothetical protein